MAVASWISVTCWAPSRTGDLAKSDFNGRLIETTKPNNAEPKSSALFLRVVIQLLPARAPAGKNAKGVAHPHRAVTIQIAAWINAVKDAQQQDEVLEANDIIAVEVFRAAFFGLINPSQATKVGRQWEVPNAMEIDVVFVELGDPKTIWIQSPDCRVALGEILDAVNVPKPIPIIDEIPVPWGHRRLPE